LSDSTGGSDRRFGGVARLYGDTAADRIRAAHVVVIGIGGVGSWAAEALARCGVRRLTLIDMDHVAESNVNRQVHALGSTLGASKIEVMAARIADISPDIRIDLIDDFVTVDNAQAMITPLADVVIDAIDAPRAKAAVIALCAARAQPIIVCGAAGGRVDPLALRRADLTEVRGDPLVASVRARLRREHGFTRDKASLFGVEAIWSLLPPVASGRGVGAVRTVREEGEGGASTAPGAPLACSGYGSTVMVTAAMGLAAAAWAVEAVSNRARRLQLSPP